jgi:Spy/CpxP family protein refolding chaperone
MGNRPMGDRAPGDIGSDGSPSRAGQRAESNSARPGLELGPRGRWWDDKSFAKSLKLRPDQQKRMDSIFEQNRPALVLRYQNALEAEAQMEQASKSANPDESALDARIDSLAQANAELDKAYAHMLLQIRREMDPDQIARLARQH